MGEMWLLLGARRVLELADIIWELYTKRLYFYLRRDGLKPLSFYEETWVENYIIHVLCKQ